MKTYTIECYDVMGTGNDKYEMQLEEGTNFEELIRGEFWRMCYQDRKDTRFCIYDGIFREATEEEEDELGYDRSVFADNCGNVMNAWDSDAIFVMDYEEFEEYYKKLEKEEDEIEEEEEEEDDDDDNNTIINVLTKK